VAKTFPLYDGSDACFLQKVEQERLALAGTWVNYYALNLGTNVDPLYNEPVSWAFEGAGTDTPFARFLCQVIYQEHEDRDEMATEEGFEEDHESEMIVSKLTWDEAQTTLGIHRAPRAGDVLIAELAVHEEQNSVSFEVVRSGSGGAIHGSTEFTSYKISLRKKSKFIPRRKLDNRFP